MGIENPSLYTPHPSFSPMDPVDFRTFYPYTPNEVKHRKRTTSAQLKILENVFKRDTKPNAALRNELAMQLDMTPRGVQVWFQNRRAKEKLKAGKLATANGKPSTGTSDSDSTATSQQQQHLEQLPSSAQEQQDTSSDQSSFDAEELVLVDSEIPPAVPQQPNSFERPSMPPSPASSTWPSPLPIYPMMNPNNNSLLNIRRGSLPVNVYHQQESSMAGPAPMDPLDPLARRRSVDASLVRLSSNPYASLVRAKNGLLYGPRLSGQNRHVQRSIYPPGRSAIPYNLEMRRASIDVMTSRFSPTTSSLSPSPLTPLHGNRRALPEHHPMYSTRALVSPIPGPLPSPGFSFGAATISANSPNSADSERNSPDSFSGFTWRRGETEDDDTSASYASRFGSFASVATSDSSNTSTFPPDPTSCDPLHNPHATGRRDSCTSGHFLSHFSNLNVNGVPNQPEMSQPSDYITQANGLPSDASSAIPPGMPIQMVPYASSTPAIPSGEVTPQNQDSNVVPISQSSSLAFALHGQPEVPPNGMGSNNPSFVNSTSLEHALGEEAVCLMYPKSNNNSQMFNIIGNTSLDFNGKYQFEQDCGALSSQGGYIQYAALGDFSTRSQEDAGLQQQQIAYAEAQQPSGERYETYPINTAAPVPSIIQHGVHDSYPSYS